MKTNRNEGTKVLTPRHNKLYSESLKADIAISSKTVMLLSLEIYDDFQSVSMKI